MFIEYLSYYLIFVIIASLVTALLVMRFRFPAPHITISVMVGFILLPGFLVYIYGTYFTSIPEVKVPDLTALSLDEAFIRLEVLGLKGRHAGSLFDTRYPEGVIASQQPESGRRVKAGRMISLLTSSGKRKVLVPNLLGRPLSQAEAVLAAKGLYIGSINKDEVSQLDPGLILSQTPLPGEEIDSGSYVSLSVSATPEGGEVREMVIETREKAAEPTAQPAKEETKEGGFWPWW
ncbi:MAG: PASTA domain-containing protein [Candidatus Saganbacteria bacterium]|nr:PASTA domain-containing protein [Candidatus Saganbacteria bacterium]